MRKMEMERKKDNFIYVDGLNMLKCFYANSCCCSFSFLLLLMLLIWTARAKKRERKKES